MKEIVSLKSTALEGVSGFSVIKALASVIQRPRFPLLPQVYLKAGAALLDIIGGLPSLFPLSSQELFGLLDYASERTFLRYGNAMTLQKFLFNGESESIALDTKNIIAFTSFILEQELVKAWLAHTDVEALKCQQILMEEEEAAQKRLAELLERRRMKKLRQKEKRTKELLENSTSATCISDYVELSTNSIVVSDVSPPSNNSFKGKEESTNQDKLNDEEGKGNFAVIGPEVPNSKSQLVLGTVSPYGLELRHGAGDSTGGGDDAHTELKTGQDVAKKRELVVGSINIELNNDSSIIKDGKSCRNIFFVNMLAENELDLHTANQTTSDSRRPRENISTHNDKIHPDNIGQNFDESAKENHISENCLFSNRTGDRVADECCDILTFAEDSNLSIPVLFSRSSATTVLEQRWKESVATDHVTLILRNAE